VERAAATTPVYYYVFDLLYLNGHDLTRVPLAERKELLRRALQAGTHAMFVEYERDGGETPLQGGVEPRVRGHRRQT